MPDTDETATGGALAGGRQAAVRLILTYVGDDVQVVAQRRLTHVLPPTDPLEFAERSTGFRVEVRSADGRLRYVRLMRDPRRQTLEVPPEDAAGTFQQADVARPRGTFAVLVPDLEGPHDVVVVDRTAAPGTLQLRSDELARFALRQDGPAAPFAAPAAPMSACNRVRRTTKIVNSGPDAHRWNVVILAEGYRSDELDSFGTRARELADHLLRTPPFDQLADAINVHRIDVESCESGADHPGGCDDGVEVDTYFDATFCGSEDWPERLLVVDTSKVIAVLEHEVAHWDVGLVIVNTPVRGGSGDDLIPVASAGSGFDVALHEIGHSAFGLADEYDYKFGPDDDRDFGVPDRRRYDGPEPQEPNLTVSTIRSESKWTHLIPRGSELPTTEKADCERSDWGDGSPVPAGTVGLFEGAGYHRCGLYRPEFNCKMRMSRAPFCAVCSEHIRTTLWPFLEPVVVPDVVGMREAAAMTALEEASLEGRVGRRRLSDRPQGEVILQLPRAERRVFKGTTVTINVSLGERDPIEQSRVPNVVGMSNETATAALHAEGFTTSLAFGESSRPFGEVIGQQPNGGARVPPGSNVHLVASRGVGDIK